MALQTAIIIQNGDEEILVRILGAHIDDSDIAVDTRPRFEHPATWYPLPRDYIEVRREGT
jgi:hypothetical protein